MAPHLLHHLLDRSAETHPEKEAVVDGARRFSYAELRAAALTCAQSLHENGIERRDRVAILLDKSFEEAASIFGASLAGGVFVPVNALLQPAQVGHILSDCRVRWLITTRQRWHRLRETGADASTIERVFLVDRDRWSSEDVREVPDLFG